jgi:hypothetical protein
LYLNNNIVSLSKSMGNVIAELTKTDSEKSMGVLEQLQPDSELHTQATASAQAAKERIMRAATAAQQAAEKTAKHAQQAADSATAEAAKLQAAAQQAADDARAEAAKVQEAQTEQASALELAKERARAETAAAQVETTELARRAREQVQEAAQVAQEAQKNAERLATRVQEEASRNDVRAKITDLTDRLTKLKDEVMTGGGLASLRQHILTKERRGAVRDVAARRAYNVELQRVRTSRDAPHAKPWPPPPPPPPPGGGGGGGVGKCCCCKCAAFDRKKGMWCICGHDSGAHRACGPDEDGDFDYDCSPQTHDGF